MNLRTLKIKKQTSKLIKIMFVENFDERLLCSSLCFVWISDDSFLNTFLLYILKIIFFLEHMSAKLQ